MKHQVEIDEWYLLTIATHGTLGDGELPDLMERWAQQEVERLGLGGKLKELRLEKVRDLESKLRNTLGNEMVDSLAQSLKEVVEKLK